MADDLRNDPYDAHHFLLEIDGSEVAEIVEASGLKTATEVVEIAEGGLNTHKHVRPGASSYETLRLRVMSVKSRVLQQWRDDHLADPFNEDHIKSGSIAILNEKGDVVRRFHFVNAWPVSWEGPSLDAGNSAAAIESIELAHEGLSVSDT